MTKKKSDRDGIYKRPDGHGFWISWTDSQGRRRRRSVRVANITQARAARNAELLRVEQTRALGFTPPGDEVFKEVASRYLQYQKARLTAKAYDRERGIVECHLASFFGELKLASIRRADIQRYITKRSAKVSAHSLVKELNVIRHLLRLAVEWEIIPFNPAQGIKSPKVPAGRLRYLQPGELRALLESAPAWLCPIIALATLTGMRRGEILGLRWLDVDLRNGRVLLPQTKNGDGRIVYLNASAQQAIQSIPYTQPTAHVFEGITPGMVTVTFKRLCKRVKIEEFRYHDLRHTAASWLRMSGADIHTVAQLLGHKDLRMAARYQHLSPAFLADAVGRLDGVFEIYRHDSVTEGKALTTGMAANG
jgi:integrase